MSQSSSEKDVIARRYGRVLFDLAQEQEKTDLLTRDVSLLTTILQDNSSDWNIIINPTASHESQRRLIDALSHQLSFQTLTSRFLLVLVERGRLPLLDRILHYFTLAMKSTLAELDATLKSATELSPSTLSKVTESLNSSTGHYITLHHKIDRSLLGGAVLQIGSLMVDASLSSRLTKLRQTMKG